ncbi:MAG: nucleotide exchange factor GrpE [Treponema sp.]|nr:MAG: nucleotide exchange factor GrpE [Treponema sp.]
MAQEKEKKAEEQNENVKKTSETSDASDKKEEKTDAKPEEGKSEEKELSPEEKIAELEKQVEDLKNQALYKAAENDNWRKRMMQQKDEAVAYANASLLGDLLDSLDNFDRTLDAAKDAKDAKSIADGIKMVNKNLVTMLESKYGLKSFGKEGDEFNPDEHEAIGRVEDESAKNETLKQVYLKGYKLNDKIIRHAKVMVSIPN